MNRKIGIKDWGEKDRERVCVWERENTKTREVQVRGKQGCLKQGCLNISVLEMTEVRTKWNVLRNNERQK